MPPTWASIRVPVPTAKALARMREAVRFGFTDSQ
jgi:hypothetical protein